MPDRGHPRSRASSSLMLAPDHRKRIDLPSDIMERSQEAILAEISESNLEEIQADRVTLWERRLD